ncbi:MAG TPA: SCP2 sterol-binding domain-containing protein [Acidimicrobiales bacterium]|nr:SCP2 sterol-binding domain-containing protein [Acidimicrobiales bacterium]
MSIGVWVWGIEGAVSASSLLIGRPWTAWLSGRRYNEQVRTHPVFMEANGWITAVWTLYFALAATVTALTNPWSALAFAVPTPLLAWASFRIGDRYPDWKMERATTKGSTAMTTRAQDELREMITGKSDDEIVALLQEAPGGATAVLDMTMAGMADALDPDRALDCVVGYEIDSEGDTLSYRIEVRDHEVDAARRPPDDARVVLQLNAPEYLRLITGLLDGTEAFMSGRMRICGDVMFAPQIGRMFRST